MELSPASDDESRPARRRDGRAPQVVRMRLGRGVYAGRKHCFEEVIGEVAGTHIDDAGYGSDYCMDLGEAGTLEPDAPFRFMNHSCEPNCALEWHDLTAPGESAPRRRLFVVALDDIARGEQLTIDYGWPASRALRCRCQAAACRGWVVAAGELDRLPAV